MNQSLERNWKRARRAGVPLVAVQTQDATATITAITSMCNGDIPVVQWDVIRGLLGRNERGAAVLAQLIPAAQLPATRNLAETLTRAAEIAEDTVLIAINAHRFLQSEIVATGICNLREVFKAGGQTLVLIGPEFANIPAELRQDIMIFDDPLPNRAQIAGIVNTTIADAVTSLQAAAPELPGPDMERITDTLSGLSAFSAEQSLATCISKTGDGKIDIDREALWQRKCKVIEQTPGLRIIAPKGDKIQGYENVRGFLKRIMDGPNAPRAVVFIDEIEKLFGGLAGDTSGVTQDQLAVMLTVMQEKEYDGVIFYGVQGSGKSAIGNEIAEYGRVPCINFDTGAMKGRYVGTSENQTRQAWQIVDAITQGRALVIATCNSMTILPPELRRRFTMGTFFFDTPSNTERAAIWPVYLKKYGIDETQDGPEDTEWTGAEIKACCKIAATLGISLKEAARYVVPVAISARDKIEEMRAAATGKFISASRPGTYSKQATAEHAAGRKMRKDYDA